MKITAALPDQIALEELGRRAQRVRLDRNLAQAELAELSGVSLRTVERFEGGQQTQLLSLLHILRALGMYDGLDRLLPESSIRPMEHLKGKSGERRRASSTPTMHQRAKDLPRPKGKWTWGNQK